MNNTTLLLIAIFIGAYLLYVVFKKYCPKQNKLHRSNQAKAKKLLKKIQENAYPPNYIFGILRKTNPFVFEELLLLCFEQSGCMVIRNKRYTGDFGADGAFYDNHGNHIVIQAKRYKSAINPTHIIEFAKTIEKFKATAGLFIHTGRTGAMSYQNLTPGMKIISGNQLLELLKVKKIEKTENQHKRGQAHEFNQ